MDACVSYFNKTTQYDIPERLLNNYNAVPNPGASGSNGSIAPVENPVYPVYNPLNTWVSTSTATEFDCIGVNYTQIDPNDATKGYISSYKPFSDWASNWSDGSCLSLFDGMLNGLGTSQKTEAFSRVNFNYLQDDFNFMFSRYFNHDVGTAYAGPDGPCAAPFNQGTTGQTAGKLSNADNNCYVYVGGTQTQISNTNARQGYSLTIPGQPGYNGFLDTLIDACQNLPGVCEPMQRYMCSQCTRQDIAASPALISFCGCVAPTPPSTAFYSEKMANYDPSCDPLCNRVDTVKLASSTTGTATTCDANVCVMDAVTINSISSTGTAPVFNQVCPACANGNGNCICIIDATFDNTIPSVKGNNGESLNDQATFNQYCPNSQCYISDPNTGLFVEVACNDRLPKTKGAANVTIPTWVFIVAIGIILFALIVIFAYKYASDNVPVYLKSSIQIPDGYEYIQ